MKLLVVLIVLVALILFNAWFFMLLVGAVHLNVLTAVIPIGFWKAVPIGFLATGLFGSASAASRN